MTVARKPKPATQKDKAAEAFINGKSAVAAPADDAGTVKLTLRLPPELLDMIDRAAKRRHINRTAWIKSAISEVLDAQG